jgi:(R,R)-butanediol dehydrogenase/meso-butanediol dehydrogenase/diacetyl reductase
VIVSEIDAGRGQMALQFGATGLIDAKGDVVDQFRALTDSAPDLIIECVGVPGMIAQAIDVAPFGGEILVVGFCMKPDSFMPALAMVKELAVKFVIAYDKSDFQFVVDMMAAGRIDVDRMITDIVGFEAFPQAFESLRRPGSQCKILLRPFD